MAHRGGGGDKRAQWWSSIRSEKLDAVKYTILHSGINTPKLINEECGLTGVQIAAAENKPKALLVILDLYRQQREIAEAIDVATDDEKGMTALMIAASRGNVKCCDHLIYYGASLTKKSREGKTAKDYAAKHPDVLALIDEELGIGASAKDDGGEAEGGVDADGLTSTQRSRLKKKQLQEAANKAMMAAITASGGDDAAAAGSASGAAAGAGAAGAGSAAANPHNLPALPTPKPEPVWPELKTAMAEKRRELNISLLPAAPGSSGEAVAAAGAGAEGGEAPSPAASSSSSSSSSSSTALVTFADGSLIDPALWTHNLLNRLELHVPSLGAFPAFVGHLSALQTLIISKSGLTSLPETFSALSELKFLDASQNSLTELPASLGKLPKLEVLDLSNNKLASVDPLSGLTSLTSLLLDGNELESIDKLNYSGLARLETLSVSHNKLKSLPEEIGSLGNLSALNVSTNALEDLPSGLSELKEKKIKELKLMPNPFADKKLLKVINTDRPTDLVKQLWKFLADAGKGGKGGKKGKK